MDALVSVDSLPPMTLVRQQVEGPEPVDVAAAIGEQWPRAASAEDVRGTRVAVAVGSRGIANLPEAVRAVVTNLKEAGATPFVTPAMGSHGGATAEGQVSVLAARGITEASVGAPVKGTMDIVRLGETDDGVPLFFDRLAWEADAVVLVNRIKPHTNFTGPTESGWLKMLAVGLGNQPGAEYHHRLSLVRDPYALIASVARALLAKVRVLCAVGLVEDQRHRTVAVGVAGPETLEAREVELLRLARGLVAKLPLEELDVLIVDEIGKEISGMGLDPNVVGRDVTSRSPRLVTPRIARIFVRDLSRATEGSAPGIGQADFTTERLVRKIDFRSTAVNAVTACGPEAARIPLAYPSDREALGAALKTLRPCTPDEVRIAHIKNTLELETLLVSRACLAELRENPRVAVSAEGAPPAFDEAGNLLSPFG